MSCKKPDFEDFRRRQGLGGHERKPSSHFDQFASEFVVRSLTLILILKFDEVGSFSSFADSINS